MDIVYDIEPLLTTDEFIEILERSQLADRRPLDRPETIRAMLTHADLIVTARLDGRLIGVSRAVTDFAFCTYISDLAVDNDLPTPSIGRELVRHTHEAAGLATQLVMLGAPKEQQINFPHLGMKTHAACWIRERYPTS